MLQLTCERGSPLRQIASAIIALLCTACSAAAPVNKLQAGLHSTPAAAVAALAALPAPRLLEKTASGAPGERFLNGNQFDQGLPHVRTFPAGSTLNFAPAGDGHGTAAYAVFSFLLPDYIGPGVITTFWNSLPAAADHFLAVADFSTNRWVWISGDPASALTLPGSVDFKSADGTVLVAVLLTGSSVHDLEQLAFGSHTGPTAVLHPQFEFVDTNTTQILDGSQSIADGPIDKYEWDLDGNGSFETNTATLAQVSVTYPLAGERTVKLRVTDSENLVDVAVVKITVDTAGYDEVEPNNTIAGANALPGMGFAGWEGNLGSGGYDGGLEDYYILKVTKPATLSLGLQAPAAGAASFEMLLFDPAGISELASSSGASACNLVYRFTEVGDYLLSCTLNGGVGTDYTLGSAAHYGTGYDEVEPNNSFGAANTLDPAGESLLRANLGPGGYDGGSDDWFSLTVPQADSSFSFRISFANGAGDINMELRTEDGVIEAARTSDSGESIDHNFSTPGTYYLHCGLSPDTPAALLDYVLEVTAHGPGPQVVLTAEPELSFQGLPTLFDASATQALPGTSIVGYDWDRNGDGVYELHTTGAEPECSAALYRAADYAPRVKVRLDNGAVGIGGCSVSVIGSQSELEPNDDFMQAQELPNATTYFGDVGPGGTDGSLLDWVRWAQGNTANGTFDLDYDPSFGALTLVLIDDDGVADLVTSADHDGNEHIVYDNFASSHYYFIEVLAADGGLATLPYRLTITAGP